jgi:hypothetical protein
MHCFRKSLQDEGAIGLLIVIISGLPLHYRQAGRAHAGFCSLGLIRHTLAFLDLSKMSINKICAFNSDTLKTKRLHRHFV